MKQTTFVSIALAATLALHPLAANADDAPAPGNPELSQGAEMLSEGMKLLLQGLMSEGAEGWAQLSEWLDDLSLYEAPERLPNGDIIIRRRAPLDVPGGEAEATEL